MSTAVGSSDGASVQKVFICYRREESAPYAGRLYDAMLARFGEGNVFMDLDLAPGVDFVERITQVVSGCLALIVVIGPEWATVEDEDGKRRIEDPADFVRLEVETGLGRSDVTPIPVLVADARMPRRESLPSEIQPIARRNALELSEGRWGYDVGRLLDTLDELLPDGVGAAPVVSPLQSAPAPLDRRLILEGALVAGIAAIVGRLLAEAIPALSEAAEEPETMETALHIGGLILRRTATAAIVGAVLAVWLASRTASSDSSRPWLRGLLVGAIAGAIGGAIWALPSYLPEHNLNFHDRGIVEIRAIAVTGGLFGALIGSLWRPRRIVAALAGGAAGGVLFQLVVVATKWNNSPIQWTVLSFGLGAAAITGLALAAMFVSERRELRSRAVAGAAAD
jgi:hypothetical protein